MIHVSMMMLRKFCPQILFIIRREAVHFLFVQEVYIQKGIRGNGGIISSELWSVKINL